MNDLLWNVREAAEHFKVAPRTVAKWRERYEDFPEPVTIHPKRGPLYNPDSLIGWHYRRVQATSFDRSRTPRQKFGIGRPA